MPGKKKRSSKSKESGGDDITNFLQDNKYLLGGLTGLAGLGGLGYYGYQQGLRARAPYYKLPDGPAAPAGPVSLYAEAIAFGNEFKVNPVDNDVMAKGLFSNEGETLTSVSASGATILSRLTGWSQDQAQAIIPMLPTWYGNYKALKILLQNSRSPAADYALIYLNPDLKDYDTLTTVEAAKSGKHLVFLADLGQVIRTDEVLKAHKDIVDTYEGHKTMFILHDGVSTTSDMWTSPNGLKDSAEEGVQLYHTTRSAVEDFITKRSKDTIAFEQVEAFKMRRKRRARPGVRRPSRVTAAKRPQKRTRGYGMKTSSSKRQRKVHEGPHGGLYVIKKGRKCYLRGAQTRV